jgi:hypothetical protein
LGYQEKRDTSTMWDMGARGTDWVVDGWDWTFRGTEIGELKGDAIILNSNRTFM